MKITKTSKQQKSPAVKDTKAKGDKKEMEAPQSGEKGRKIYSLLRGMHDILPGEAKYWSLLYHTAENLAEYFQYGRIDVPLIEEASLFVRSIGRATDVVEKEMYAFEDRDGTKVALRPEATASITRAYITHGMWNNAQPVKLWYWGPMFRYDRPQTGRYRQFNQVGFETLGDSNPVIDAELILVAYNFFRDIGLPVEIHVNSIGLPEERERYKIALVEYYRAKRGYLCDDCRRRLQKNPLRLLDCKQEQCQPIKEEAPQIIDWLGDESKNHLMKVLEYLDELSVPYILLPTLVRGLGYYTRTVFEVYGTDGEQGAQSALGGGGRYDLLVEMLGGRPTSAAGMALGLERIVAALRNYNEQKKISPPGKLPEIFFAQLGDQAKRRALKMINDLRGSGINISFNFSKNSLKSQLETANDLKVPFALILGQKEVQDGTVIVRDMESGVQEIVDQRKAAALLKRKLGKV